MFRFVIANVSVFFLLSGCSVVVGGLLDDKNEGLDSGVGLDAAMDAEPVDCMRAENGTSCGSELICLLGQCSRTTCGDGFADAVAGEECDDANDVGGDGCEQGCLFTCSSASDCDDGNACSGTERCDEHRCEAEPPTRDQAVSCGEGGTCVAGLCAPMGCGDEIVDAGEQCDDGNEVNDDTCKSDCTLPCTDDIHCDDTNPCNGVERCVDSQCVAGTELVCDDGEPCTADSCDPTLETGCVNDFIDEDGDSVSPETCANATLHGADCDDSDATVYPGADEQCDQIDHDCDRVVDNDTTNIACEQDIDGDGYGNSGVTVTNCSCPDGFIAPRADGAEDCADGPGLGSVFPGQRLYFDSAFRVATPRYDYNCDNTDTARYLVMNRQCQVMGSGSRRFCTGSGWVGSVPVCGASRSYRTCYVSSSGNACLTRTESRRQPCR